MTENPYETLEAAAAGSVEYPFKGVVGMSDVRRVCRSTRFSGVFLGLFGGFLLIVGMDSLRFGSPRSAGILLLAATALLILGIRFWRWPKQMLKSNRFLLGPVRGVLRTGALEIESHHIKMTLAKESYRVERIVPHAIGLVVNVYRLLPGHLFDDFANACELATEVRRTSVPAPPGDERYKELVPDAPENVGPEGSIRIAGAILNRDLATPQLNKALRKIWLAIVAWSVFGALGVWFIWALTDQPILTVGVGTIVLLWLSRKLAPLWQTVKTYRGINPTDDRVLFSVRGWMNDTTLAVWNRLSVAHYEWAAFESYQLRDTETLVLHLQKNVMHVCVHRRLFASDDEWARAREIVEKHVQPDGTPQ